MIFDHGGSTEGHVSWRITMAESTNLNLKFTRNKFANLLLLAFAVALISGCKQAAPGGKVATGTTNEFKGVVVVSFLQNY